MKSQKLSSDLFRITVSAECAAITDGSKAHRNAVEVHLFMDNLLVYKSLIHFDFNRECEILISLFSS